MERSHLFRPTARRPLPRYRNRAASSGQRTLAAAAVAIIFGLLVGPLSVAADPPATIPAPSSGAQPAVAVPGPTKPGYSKLVDTTAVLQPALGAAAGRSTVFVRFRTAGAAAVSAQAAAKNLAPEAIRRAVTMQRITIGAQAAEVSAAAVAVDPAAVTTFTVQNAVAGIGLTADNRALRALAGRSDVEKISAIVPKVPANAGAASLTRSLQAWTDLGVTGRGVRIGVIDTGIDYTHADFSAAGSVEAYRAASTTARLAWAPNATVVGGYDFVGDDYDAAPTVSPTGSANPSYQPVPHPDPNPLDCNGHGTHVAGTAAGRGVTAQGQTFTGSYSTLSGTDLYGMRVAPGMAPQAALYALKVFGCAGASGAVIPALDWALDPDGNGDFADHLDIVDLSLQSTVAAADDPDTTVLDAVAGFGVLPVVAVGNNGDHTDSASSLTWSVRSLAVASSADEYQRLDGLTATLPSAAPSSEAGQASLSYPWAASPGVSGEVVSLPAGNADGCAPVSGADVSRIAGKLVWLKWEDDDATRRCGSAARAANVRTAGAVGALLTSGTPVFAAAITGDPTIPVFQLTAAATATLQPGVDSGLRVTLSGGSIGTMPQVKPSIGDLISVGSARGPHGPAGLIKPDVTAPGDTVFSADMGTGSAGTSMSGTSMAAAEVAGIAALVRQAHPTWTTEQLKAAVMNSADHDVYALAGQSGPALGPDRVGAGRVDARSALGAQVLAYSSTNPGAVSAAFGVVPADVGSPSVVATSAIVVQNTGSATTNLTLAFQPLVGQPGVQYQVSPATMELPASSSALATVTMTITPSALRHTVAPGTAVQQRNRLTGLDEARQYVSAASGRVLLTAPGSPPVRVPVYGAAEPVSATTADDGTAGGSPAVTLSGTGFSLSSPADPLSTAYNSLVSVLDLGYRSGAVPRCTADQESASPAAFSATAIAPDRSAACSAGRPGAGDIQAVGAGRTPADANGPGYLWFGVSTYGKWATVGNDLFPTVNIDVNGDNTADYTVQVQAVGQNSDLLYAMLFNAGGSLLGIYPVNFNLGNVDTNVFDTDVLLIPVDPTALGLRASDTSFPIRYSVATFSTHAAAQNSGAVDITPAIAFDVAQPKISTSAPLWQDEGGTGIPYRLAQGVTGADALVIHLHGADATRHQVVRLHGGTG